MTTKNEQLAEKAADEIYDRGLFSGILNRDAARYQSKPIIASTYAPTFERLAYLETKSKCDDLAFEQTCIQRDERTEQRNQSNVRLDEAERVIREMRNFAITQSCRCITGNTPFSHCCRRCLSIQAANKYLEPPAQEPAE